MSDFKRSLKSSSGRMAAGIIGQVINTVGQVAVFPLFLHFWTKRGYGEWLILTAVPNLLWSLEGGLGFLAINQMVMHSSVGDWKKANQVFQNIFVVQMVVSVLMMVCAFLFVRTFNFLPFFDIAEMSRPEAGFVLMTMVVYMLFGWGITLLRAPYFAAQRSVRGTMVTNLWRLCDFLIIGLVLFFQGRPSALAVGEMTVAALWVFLSCLDLRRICPEFRFHLGEVSWPSCKAAGRDGFPLFLLQAGTALFIQGYPLVLGRTLGTLAVVNFTAIRTVTRVLLQGIVTITSAAAVELTGSFAQKKWEVYLRWVKILTAIVILASICACLGLRYLGPQIISIWSHGKVAVDGPLLLLFGMSVSLQAGWTLFGTLLYTANKHHIQCYIYFGVTVATLVLGWLTIGRLGFSEVPILMIGADAVVLASSLFLCRHYLPEVDFVSLGRLLHPLFYWNKIKWVSDKVKNR